MKKFNVIAILLIAALVFSCVSAPKVAEIGSTNVDLLKNGKAKVIDFISINDFHAALDEELTGKSPGAAKLATVILDAQKANPNTILLSAGDNYQGSALSSITKGLIVSEFFKTLNLRFSAVGNHELDWGLANFAGWEKDGNIEFLAANIIEKSTGKAPVWAKPYKLVKVGGHTVAIIGLMTKDTLTTVIAKNIAPFDITDAAAATQAIITELNKKIKPELIIALAHIPAGTDKVDATKAIGMPTHMELESLGKVVGLDAIISGHSHSTVAGSINGIPVVQGYYNGRTLAKLSITFNEDGTKKITPSVNEFFKTKKDIAENPDVKALVARYMAQFGGDLTKKVATLNGALSHDKNVNVTPMGYWVCETLRDYYKLDMYIQNGGGLRKGFVAGDVLVKDFWELMPFDNYTVTFEMSGADIKKALEHGLDSPDFGNGQFAGVIVTYDPTLAYKSKIVSVALANGTALEDAKMYKVGTNDFQFTGGDKYTMMKPAAKNIVETFEPVRDILLAVAQKAGAITAPAVNVLIKK